jgi:hypothetical protein
MYEALERMKTSMELTRWSRISSLRDRHERRVCSMPAWTLSHESWTVLEKTGEMVMLRPLTCSEARSHYRGQSRRPAQVRG